MVDVFSVITDWFVMVVPLACFIGLMTRLARFLVRVCSGGVRWDSF